MTAPAWPLAPGWRTRFAPAPTGFLHLGHVANALFVWGLARAWGGRVVLRIEDHDRTRSRPEYETALLDDLDWLGFAPDEGSPADLRRGPSPFRQSDCEARYAAALDGLAARGLVYACRCSRRTIAGAVGEPPPGVGRTPALAITLRHRATRRSSSASLQPQGPTPPHRRPPPRPNLPGRSPPWTLPGAATIAPPAPAPRPERSGPAARAAPTGNPLREPSVDSLERESLRF